MSKTDMTVANEILRQLGGNAFARMTGSKYFTGRNDSLGFMLARNISGGNVMRITLNAMDEYDITIHKSDMRGLATGRKTLEEAFVLKHEVKGIYADQLLETFQGLTGLETRMPRVVVR